MKTERLIVLVIVGFLMFNYPLMSLFSEGMFLGIPVPYLYLFGFWALFIYLVSRTSAKTDETTSGDPVEDSSFDPEGTD